MAASNRDSPVPEDDGSLTVTAGLAKEAALLFQTGKFVDCLKVLHQLLQKKEGDPKVLHNIAIAENFQDGCSDPKRLLEVLCNVKKRSEELAYASGEHVEAVGNLGNKAMIGTNNMAGGNSSPIVYNDEFDTSVAMFNTAVTWFHLHEYENAFSKLEVLYQNIEPIDEGTALRICLLLLDVALLTHHTTRSADVINYVEKVFCANNLINQGDSGISSSLVPKSSSVPNPTPITEGSSSDSAAIVNASESPLSRTLSEDAEYDNLFSTLDISGQNLQRPSVFPSDLPKTQTDELISIIDLRLKLHLYKVQLLLLMRNPKAAKREVKMAMNMARGKDYTMALFLKSQLEYARGNHRKAIKLLLASSNRNETGTSSLYYNNLGCINYQLGKHNTSAVFFSRALNSTAPLRKEKPLKLLTFSQDKAILIAYNCGVQYLSCGKPIPAAHCFIKASLVFYNRPLLWIRLAECCLMALEKGLIKPGVGHSNESELNIRVIGEGKWRSLAIDDGNLKNGQENLVGKEEDKQPNLSLSLARQCLLNALHLLESFESGLPIHSAPEEKEKTAGLSQGTMNGEAKEQKIGSNNLNATLQSSMSDYAVICKKENLLLKQTLLADLALVELELGNPSIALSAAKSLLKLPECYRTHVFLGNVYAAEALCILGHSKEAAEHLSIYLSGENEVELPYGQEDYLKLDLGESNGGGETVDGASRGVGFLRPEEAHGTLFANMAALAAMEGDFEQAHQYVTQALRYLTNKREVVLTATYIDLMQGRTQEALVKLKECTCVRFVPGSLKLNGGP
ncbi:hypothetical protein LguiB_010428 [Lonicera macranthoides]